MPILELHSTTWAEFKSDSLTQLFAPEVPARGRYYFRGQSSADYTLISSFDRWYTTLGTNTKNLSKKDATDRFLELFREEAGRLSPDPSLPTNIKQLLALAQHYGVPTRLLDWTESPYVAAFFAFSELALQPENPANRIAIWCLDTEARIWAQDTGIKLLSAASPYNERLRNQLGKFTLLQSPFDTVEAHIAQCDQTNTALRKLTLPVGEAKTALSDLDFMGITYSTIYPGLDGCARAANLRMLLEQ